MKVITKKVITIPAEAILAAFMDIDEFRKSGIKPDSLNVEWVIVETGHHVVGDYNRFVKKLIITLEE